MLIDKEVALKKMCEMCYYNTGQNFVCRKCNVYELLAEQPAVEAEPVRHGQWIDAHFVNGGDFYRCSECGCYIEKIYFANDYNVRYCPNCGAKMDGSIDGQNESWFTNNFNQCDNCPDWDDEKGCKSHGKECEDGGIDNEEIYGGH